MEKTYYLVYMIFGENNKNTYSIFEYQKSRRFTARQAWNHIRHEEKKTIVTGNLSPNATIEDYWAIIKKLSLNKKVCDRYCHFEFIKN